MGAWKSTDIPPSPPTLGTNPVEVRYLKLRKGSSELPWGEGRSGVSARGGSWSGSPATPETFVCLEQLGPELGHVTHSQQGHTRWRNAHSFLSFKLKAYHATNQQRELRKQEHRSSHCTRRGSGSGLLSRWEQGAVPDLLRSQSLAPLDTQSRWQSQPQIVPTSWALTQAMSCIIGHGHPLVHLPGLHSALPD